MKSAAADRLDFGAQAIQRVAVDAREQPPIAPLELRRARRVNCPRRTTPSRSSASSAASASVVADRQRRRERRGRRRADDRERVRAAARRSRRRASRRARRATGGRGDRRRQRRRRDGRPAFGQPLGGDPDRRDPRSSRCAPRAPRQLVEAARGGIAAHSSRGQEAGGQQRVVQLVGVARIGTRLVAHARDRVGVERAEVVAPTTARSRGARRPPASAAPRAAHRRGTRRARVEDLVRERRRLGRVARDAAAARRRECASSTRAQAVEVHRLFEAVADRLADQRMIGNLRGRRGCSRGRRRRRGRRPPSDRRPCIRCSCGGTFLPPRLRGTASEIVVFQRQRVWNTGASSNACTSTSRAVAGCR